jgi:glutamate racemase
VRRVGIIGTLATIDSGAYEKALREREPGLDVLSRACPLLVPLAEEGWLNNEVARKTLNIYLAPFKQQQPEALILGCTHYPLFKESIGEELNNPDIKIIDSAISIANKTRQILEEHKLQNTQNGPGKFHCVVSDKPQRFQQLAERFLGRTITDVQVTDL